MFHERLYSFSRFFSNDSNSLIGSAVNSTPDCARAQTELETISQLIHAAQTDHPPHAGKRKALYPVDRFR